VFESPTILHPGRGGLERGQFSEREEKHLALAEE
jgi:hypothetical protein